MAGAQVYVRFDDATLSDLKVRKLMAAHGFAGLGAYFATVLHMMRDREDFDMEAVPVVASECFEDAGEYKALLDDMARIGLIVPEAYEEGMIRSKRVYEELAYLDALQESAKAAGKASGEARRRKANARNKQQEQ